MKRAPVTINENDFFEPKGFSSKIRADLARQSEMLGTTCALVSVGHAEVCVRHGR